MPLSVDEILTFIGFEEEDEREEIAIDLMREPAGILHLLNETAEGIERACASYSKRPEDERFDVSRIGIRGIISLMYWVKDQERVGEPIEFADGTTNEEFLDAIFEAYRRNDLRTSQRKTGDRLITTKFQAPLKTSAQYDRWMVELQTVCGLIIGAKGVPFDRHCEYCGRFRRIHVY